MSRPAHVGALATESRLPTAHLKRANEDPRLLHALMAEFAGVALLQLLSGSVAQGPLQTALTFAGIMYGVQYLSGGHLNPAVSLAALGSGHLEIMRGIYYIIAQLLGGFFGALLQVLITPGERYGRHSFAACFSPVSISGPQLFTWEMILTFLFVIVMYAAVFTAPGHGTSAPLAAGLALFGVTATGGMFTGFSPVNPARIIAAMMVFHCDLRWGWTYLTAQLAGSGLALVWAWAMYGKGMWFGGARPDAFSGAHGTLTEGLLAGGRGGTAGDPAGSGYGTI